MWKVDESSVEFYYCLIEDLSEYSTAKRVFQVDFYGTSMHIVFRQDSPIVWEEWIEIDGERYERRGEEKDQKGREEVRKKRIGKE